MGRALTGDSIYISDSLFYHQLLRVPFLYLNYVEWSLKRDIWVKLHFFGQKMEDEIDKENKLQTYHPKNILDILPDSFTEEQFIQARQQLGLKGSHKEHLKKLRQRRKIDFDETTQMYVKVKSKEE